MHGKKNSDGLSDQQQRFVDEYLVDLNATQAAIRASYKPHSADQQASRLLANRKIAAAIARAKATRSRRTGITQDRVLRELARVAFVNPEDVINMDTAEVRTDANENDKAVIAGVKVKYIPHKDFDDDGAPIVEQAIEREVKLCDKLKALDMLAKHLGMYDKSGDDEGRGESGVAQIPAVMPPTTPPEDDEDGGDDG